MADGSQSINITAKIDGETLRLIGEACRYVLGPIGAHWDRMTAETALRTKFHLWEKERENLERINDLAEKKWRHKPFSTEIPSSLDSKSAYKFITNASKESDPDIQEMWANLLVEASKPGSENRIDEVAIETLTRIDNKSCITFKWLMDNCIDSISPQPFSHMDWGEDKRFFLFRSDQKDISSFWDGPIVRSLLGFRQYFSENFERSILLSTENEVAYDFIMSLDRLEKLSLLEQCPLARIMADIKSDLKVYHTSYFGRKFYRLVNETKYAKDDSSENSSL